MTDRERIALAEEAQSLPIHVQMCAMRHEAIMGEIKDLRTDTEERLARIEKSAERTEELLSQGAGGFKVLKWFGFGSLASVIATGVTVYAWFKH